MATQAETTQTKARRPTLFGWMLSLPFRIVVVVVISILTSITIEWLGIYFGWWDLPGAQHAQHMFSHELGWIDTEFTRSLLVSNPAATGQNVLAWVYQTVFVSTGITGWFDAHADGDGLAHTIAIYSQAALDVCLVVMIRVFILALTIPLFVMAAFVAIVDGLVRRDLRRFGAGRESAFIYHHAKRITGPVFVLGWLAYLSLPFSIHPNLFLVPCAAGFGVLVSVTVGSFKKYL
ncbi:TIGR03747 family integrating conjugative element membrane protein [Salinisphaera orenii]|uniref:TIGR03747 family integrating conjugative element membrane protein n=1 Tax=Salinisphaera orenii TaxID=856731 RepID=UPI000DBE4D17